MFIKQYNKDNNCPNNNIQRYINPGDSDEKSELRKAFEYEGGLNPSSMPYPRLGKCSGS